jgi:hypothetical protein
MKYTSLILMAVLIAGAMAQTNKDFHIGISAHCGGSESHIEADKLMKVYFSPTSPVIYRRAPFIGAEIEFFLGKYAALSAGLTNLCLGQTTGTDSVFFEDSQFKHSLSSTSIINYVGVPIVLKGGISTAHFASYLRGGVMPICLAKDSVSWRIDGRRVNPGTRIPTVGIKWYDILLLVGVEAGTWIGNNGIFLVADYGYSAHSMAEGIEGEAFNRAIMVSLKYTRKIF